MKIYNENLNLLDYLPPTMQEISEIKTICNTENPEFKLLFKNSQQALDNCFITTCNEEQLSFLESLLKLNVDVKLNVEQRREQVLLSWGTQLPYTLNNIYNILNVLIGENSYTLNVNYDEYKFYINTNFIDKNKSLFLYNTLRKIVPANLIIINTNNVNLSVEISINGGMLAREFITYRIGG